MTESLFTTQTPTSPSNTESTYTLGTLFRSDINGQILGIRVYAGGVVTGSVGALFQVISETAGTLLKSQAFPSATAPGWNTVMFDTPVDIVAGQNYMAAWGNTNNYGVTPAFFATTDLVNGHLTAPKSGGGLSNGKFHDGTALAYPDQTFNDNCYFVDVIFQPSTGTNLAVANAAQAQTVGNVVLTQTHKLTVQNARQAQTVDNVSLGIVAIDLVVANAQQLQTVASPTLHQTHILTVQNARQNQRSTQVVFPSQGAGKRQEFQRLLEEILGTSHVYFQPPENLKMQYPCIVYVRDNADSRYADNYPYRYTKRYQVTVIDRDPDSQIPDRVATLRMSSHNRFFIADGLNHDVFDVYY